MIRDTLVIVRGGGELATGGAHLLFRCGFPVIVLELPQPLAVRRRVCFAEAVRSGEVVVEEVPARRCEAAAIDGPHASRGFVPVLVDPEARCVERLRPQVLVDGRMAKRDLGTRLADAPLVVGLGPGFRVGTDVHAAIETQRGLNLGRVFWSGGAEADSGVPAPVLGVGAERVLRAPRGGLFRGSSRIGAVVAPGEQVGDVEGAPVTAGVGGLVRGLLADGVSVREGMKVGDVDPRGSDVDPGRLSDKARATGSGVLEAVLVRFRGAL
jgi:xanthine dehydrogenase accessory factor